MEGCLSKSVAQADYFQTAAESACLEELLLPHLKAAYKLARWLTRNEHDAQDVVQEAYLRALKFFGGFHGPDARAWLLMIVRNCSYTWLKRNRSQAVSNELDEATRGNPADIPDPETSLNSNVDKRLVWQAMEMLPVEFREMLVLRELEELSYKEISVVTGIPIGTVMSRLARARKKLQTSFEEILSCGSDRSTAISLHTSRQPATGD